MDEIALLDKKKLWKVGFFPNQKVYPERAEAIFR